MKFECSIQGRCFLYLLVKLFASIDCICMYLGNCFLICECECLLECRWFLCLLDCCDLHEFIVLCVSMKLFVDWSAFDCLLECRLFLCLLECGWFLCLLDCGDLHQFDCIVCIYEIVSWLENVFECFLECDYVYVCIDVYCESVCWLVSIINAWLVDFFYVFMMCRH